MPTAGSGDNSEDKRKQDGSVFERTFLEERAWPWEEPMPLKLRVISDQYKQLGKSSSQLFGVRGGNIGRALDNDWVLPDPDRYISSRHATVSFRAGGWMLEDVSTNGVYVNDGDSPLSVTGPRKLKDGDRLRLGDYDIIVSIEEKVEEPASAPPPPARTPVKSSRKLADQADYLRGGTFRNNDNRPDDRHGTDLGEDLDITGLLVSGSRDARESHTHEDRSREDQDAVVSFDLGMEDPTPFSHSSIKPMANTSSGRKNKVSSSNTSLLDSFLQESPAKASSAGTAGASNVTEDWHMNTRRLQRKPASAAPLLHVVPPPTPPTPVQPNKAHAPVMRAESSRAEQRNDNHRHENHRDNRSTENDRRRAPESTGDMQSGVEALCRGAGIDPATIPLDAHGSLLTLAGQVVREVVLDLMEALRTRGDHKNRLQLGQTTIQPNHNNPLKLSTSVEDALRKLLDSHNTRNLGAVEAVREAFTDLKNHQIAVDAGMNAALNDLLGRVDPSELQERFDRGLKRNAPQGVINKGKYWELYTDFYPLLNQRDTRGWPAVFTEEFTRAYATKVDELENSKKK